MERCCENCLRLEGDEAEINRFIAKTRTEDEGETTYGFNISEFLEFPEDLINTPKSEEERQRLISKFGHDNLSDWCIANWGTDDDCDGAEYDEDTHSLTFITCDSTPDKAIVVISKLYPTLKFTFEYKNFNYEDEAVADFGRFVCQNGKIESEEYSKVKAAFCPACDQVMTYIKI